MRLSKSVTSHSLTVRLPVDLYTRLQICALEKQRNGDTPELSQIVREALELYLRRHQRKTQRKTHRQTRKAVHG